MILRARPVPFGPAKVARAKARLTVMLIAAALISPSFISASLPAAAQESPAQVPQPATECWRGWGYLLDSRTGGYKSQEMLLVTIGAPLWQIGRPVELFQLDRTSGLISDVPSFTVVPENPRQYFRGRLNYVNTTARIEGSEDRIVIGLNHIEPAQSAVPAKERYNRWACGFPEE